MGRRTLSMQQRKRFKPEGKKNDKKKKKEEEEEVVEVMTAPPHTTTRHPQKGKTTRMTEEETAALFLADLAVATTTNDDTIAACGTEGGLSTAVKEGDKPSNTRVKRKKISSAVVPKTTRSGKHVPTDTRKTSTVKPCVLGSVGLSAVPLEEGEEDPSVSAEVLRQTAAFLARLTPARSQEFWAMRQVARGELSSRSAAKMRTTELTLDDNAREWEEEDEEDVEFTSSEGVHDRKISGAAGKEVMSSSFSSSSEGEEEVFSPTMERNKTHAAAKCRNKVTNKKRPRGGALFSSNPDLWDD
ncbi:hypothetical protein MOQ_007156 [Trypanosoma cruzi marinkellei]|uniref:Uncharacterized protein n=1 Tax=Trypanosoma cruzi marinkellei TaxID=85056 RepID=K2MPS1_TRYCR|nr:hypothetical protein MOQ_007156 [Trypanosoma cruzi marinkellei]